MTMVPPACVESVELGPLSTTQYVFLSNLTSSLVLIGETNINTGYFYIEVNSSLTNIMSVTGRTGASMPAYSLAGITAQDSLCKFSQMQSSYPFNQVPVSSLSGLCGENPTSLGKFMLFSPGLFFVLIQVASATPFTLQASLNAIQCSINTTNRCMSPAIPVSITSYKALGSYTIPGLGVGYWYIDIPAGALSSLSFNVDSSSGDGWVDSYINSPYINRAFGTHSTGTEVIISSWAPSSFNWQAEDFYAGGRFYFAVWTAEDEESITVRISINMQGVYTSVCIV